MEAESLPSSRSTRPPQTCFSKASKRSEPGARMQPWHLQSPAGATATPGLEAVTHCWATQAPHSTDTPYVPLLFSDVTQALASEVLWRQNYMLFPPCSQLSPAAPGSPKTVLAATGSLWVHQPQPCMGSSMVQSALLVSWPSNSYLPFQRPGPSPSILSKGPPTAVCSAGTYPPSTPKENPNPASFSKTLYFGIIQIHWKLPR